MAPIIIFKDYIEFPVQFKPFDSGSRGRARPYRMRQEGEGFPGSRWHSDSARCKPSILSALFQKLCRSLPLSGSPHLGWGALDCQYGQIYQGLARLSPSSQSVGDLREVWEVAGCGSVKPVENALAIELQGGVRSGHPLGSPHSNVIEVGPINPVTRSRILEPSRSAL